MSNDVEQVEDLNSSDATGYVDPTVGDGVDGGSQEDPFAVFGGEELKVEARRKDAHRGQIISVGKFESPNTGSLAVKIQFISQDTGGNDDLTVWVPKLFAEHTGEFLRRELGIEDLSPGVPDVDRPGKLKGNERAQYGMAIKNSAGDAAIQTLLSVAAKSGRKPTPGVKIETFDDYCTELAQILTDVDVIYTRVPQVTDDNPRGFLHVNRVYFPEDVLSNPAKSLKSYFKHWEAADNA